MSSVHAQQPPSLQQSAWNCPPTCTHDARIAAARLREQLGIGLHQYATETVESELSQHSTTNNASADDQDIVIARQRGC